MFEPRLSVAMAAGSTVVTPNKRLSRALVAAYDRANRMRGLRAWPAARVLPWSAWLEELWSDVLAHGGLPSIARLLRAPQTRRRWQQIVGASDLTFANAAGAADLAAQAWMLSKAWGSGGESWRGWRSDAPSDDCAIYAGWAERFHRALRDMRAVDDASLADALASAATDVGTWRRLDVVVAGFIEPTPQQQRLIGALAQQGAHIERCDTLAGEPTERRLTSAASPRDEMLLALIWARDEALANPGATIGIAVEDLASRRPEVIALSEDVLCPALQFPGHESDTRPYNVSLGANLASAPLVSAALDWIEIAGHSLPLARAAAMVRSPYLPEARLQWARRAAVELDWLNKGRREVGCGDIAQALEGVDKAQGERVRRALVANRFLREASPKEWVDAWRRWLAALGWPGDRALSSTEQQTREAFDELLANFATIAIVDEHMRIADAQNALRDLARETVFQPESPAVPIQIVGLLEATGLPFDRLWIAGLAAERWPRPPEPHPLLPPAWQRDHDVPRSSAARELRFARTTTAMLLRGAPQVVVSYAQGIDDDRPPRPSALVAELRPPSFVSQAADTRGVSYARRMHATRPAPETISDHRAPAIAEGMRIHGGAHVFEAQANCPFQAVALHRLDADRWPDLVVGLTPIERGTLVHAALAALWTDIRGSTTLAALSEAELADRITAATTLARRALTSERWRFIPPAIEAGETSRIVSLIRDWIDRYERRRPSFAVEANELKVDLALAGIALRLRIDRIDRTAEGAVIIDYKTGLTLGPKAWFDPRPRSPQIGLYALARRQAAPDSPARAVAYAQMRSGDLRLNGVAADAAIWPALLPIADTAVRSWAEFEAWWDAQLGKLAEELRGGVAEVAPREGPKTCRTCGLWALCRVGGVALGSDEPRDE